MGRDLVRDRRARSLLFGANTDTDGCQKSTAALFISAAAYKQVPFSQSSCKILEGLSKRYILKEAGTA
jgi:hypothetical protein